MEKEVKSFREIVKEFETNPKVKEQPKSNGKIYLRADKQD
jgi:hypothetical protein